MDAVGFVSQDVDFWSVVGFGEASHLFVLVCFRAKKALRCVASGE